MGIKVISTRYEYQGGAGAEIRTILIPINPQEINKKSANENTVLVIGLEIITLN